MDLKGSTLPFPMGLPLQDQETGLGSQQVEFRADSLSQLRGSAPPSQVMEENRQELGAEGPDAGGVPAWGPWKWHPWGAETWEWKKGQ